MSDATLAAARERLLGRLARSIRDRRVLDAMAAVPRECFVPPDLRAHAWDDEPLPIGDGQTISQPFIVARMCELLGLRGPERILDVGTGSGYHAAVLSHLGAHVWSVERIPELSAAAAGNLAAAGCANVTLVVGDGAAGLPAEAPFDAINVAAAARALPRALEDQLAVGGRLVAPVGDAWSQELVVVQRTPDGLVRRAADPVRFVPLVPGAPG